jgi:hypothetical protein
MAGAGTQAVLRGFLRWFRMGQYSPQRVAGGRTLNTISGIGGDFRHTDHAGRKRLSVQACYQRK